jgi:hypothetical protein
MTILEGWIFLYAYPSIEDAVMAIRVDLAEIKGKLSHMPTTWSLVVIVIGVVFTVMAGTLGIVKLLHP